MKPIENMARMATVTTGLTPYEPTGEAKLTSAASIADPCVINRFDWTEM